MNAKQIEVHNYFKAMYTKALILYHFPGQYIVLGEDVERALKSNSHIQLLEEGVGAMPDDILYLSALGVDGIEVQLIEYRNDSGALDWPDVKRLQEEKDMDY